MPANPTPVDRDDDATLPSLEALIVGTLALATSWADPAADARVDTETQRRLMARKLVSNLFFLHHHPLASPAFREVAARLHARWVTLAEGEAPCAAAVCPGAAPSHLH